MIDQPLCPVCQEPAVEEVRRLRRGIGSADYLCPNEHIWTTRWLVPVTRPSKAG